MIEISHWSTLGLNTSTQHDGLQRQETVILAVLEKRPVSGLAQRRFLNIHNW
jgi:hypothetical protein